MQWMEAYIIYNNQRFLIFLKHRTLSAYHKGVGFTLGSHKLQHSEVAFGLGVGIYPTTAKLYT